MSSSCVDGSEANIHGFAEASGALGTASCTESNDRHGKSGIPQHIRAPILWSLQFSSSKHGKPLSCQHLPTRAIFLSIDVCWWSPWAISALVHSFSWTEHPCSINRVYCVIYNYWSKTGGCKQAPRKYWSLQVYLQTKNTKRSCRFSVFKYWLCLVTFCVSLVWDGTGMFDPWFSIKWLLLAGAVLYTQFHAAVPCFFFFFFLADFCGVFAAVSGASLRFFKNNTLHPCYECLCWIATCNVTKNVEFFLSKEHGNKSAKTALLPVWLFGRRWSKCEAQKHAMHSQSHVVTWLRWWTQHIHICIYNYHHNHRKP